MSISAFCVSYVLWAIWSMEGGCLLPASPIGAFVVDTAVKTVIWLGPMVYFLLFHDDQWLIPPRKIFSNPFPWLPTFVGLCLTLAFLHTMRILLVGINTRGIFQPMWIFMSLSAAVIEELAFRGFLFNCQRVRLGTGSAAAVNALLFALYHFPEFLLGRGLAALLGLRFWVCALMGFVFSVVFARWKNLGMNIVVHFAWNMLCYFFALS